jgi:hypothetical protein
MPPMNSIERKKKLMEKSMDIIFVLNFFVKLIPSNFTKLKSSKGIIADKPAK